MRAIFFSAMLLMATVVGMLTGSTRAAATYQPNQGDIYYNGVYYADSYFAWYSPGPWQNPGPGYEHDLNILPSYFDSCTSTTNMPYGYDDCPTAGVDERSNYWAFTFGTFHSDQLQANITYFGSWSFGGGTNNTSPFYLYGQENRHCWPGNPDNIWGMCGVQSQLLYSETFHWTITLYRTWSN